MVVSLCLGQRLVVAGDIQAVPAVRWTRNWVAGVLGRAAMGTTAKTAVAWHQAQARIGSSSAGKRCQRTGLFNTHILSHPGTGDTEP